MASRSFIKEEKGASTIVEATIVFPVMFLSLFFMLFLGNAYFQMSKIDSFVAKYAIDGAAACTDPFYYSVLKSGSDGGDISVPTSNNSIQPYRYFLHETGNIAKVKSDMKEKLEESIDDCGFFFGMEPTVTYSNVQYKSNFFYATFIVEVHYEVVIPVRLFGDRQFKILASKARAEVPVNDPADFILNTDMVIDYVMASKTGNKIVSKISSAMGKVREFLAL